MDSGAANQAAALESPMVDTATPTPPPQQTDAPKAEEANWKQDVAALGVDPGWVVALRQKLVETGKIRMEDIQADVLADPEHRKWLNRLMKQQNDSEAAASQAAQTQGAPAQPTQVAQANPQQTAPTAASSKPAPSVLKPGHMPTGPLWQGTATPGAGGGWIPTGNGLWWPPWPVTGGPIQKPAVQSATQQANALDTTTGQARPDLRG